MVLDWGIKISVCIHSLNVQTMAYREAPPEKRWPKLWQNVAVNMITRNSAVLRTSPVYFIKRFQVRMYSSNIYIIAARLNAEQ